MSRLDAEVIVVGSGPAGAAAAIRLAEAGHDVLVLERKEADDGIDYASGELFSPAAQVELAEINVALEGDWVLDRVSGVRNVYPDLSWTHHPFPEGLSYVQADRGGFNNALRQRLRGLGVRIAMGTRVNELRIDTDRVCVQGARGEEYSAALLIDAGGRYSPTLRSRGLKSEDPEFQQIGVALFFDSFTDTPLNTWDRHLFGTHGMTISGSRMKPGLYRYILEADLADKQSAQLKPVEFFERMAEELDGWIFERIMHEPRRPGFWSMAPIGYRVAEVAGDRFLLAGDAAGYLSPFTGQGVEFAMRTGRLAARAAQQAFAKHDFSAATFASYVQERQSELDTMLAYLRHQLRVLRDRDGLLLASRDEGRRLESFGPMAALAGEQGSLLGEIGKFARK